ncbi:transposase, partial [Pseudovibrio axinellae]|uniref:transposase n=1 Tax=Pseudovibrio axinellae TaxID=989403 RepID=UPI00193DE92F
MPYKFNALRRHKFVKPRFRITNWSEYNESLRGRGDVTVWISDAIAHQWAADRRTTRGGGQAKYSSLAIETCLTVRVVFGLA